MPVGFTSLYVMASNLDKKRTGRGSCLKRQCRELVYNLRTYFEEENRNGGPLISVSKVVVRVAAVLQIGESDS